jgi:Trk-type K+ transport system membrane component
LADATTRRRLGLAPRLRLGHPAQLVTLAFLVAVLAGTGLLLLPVARAGPGGAGLLTALFTATSAVCVTGLVVHDTAVYWTGFGHAVIAALIQVGGFGIMSLASLFAVFSPAGSGCASASSRRRRPARSSSATSGGC